MFQPNRCAVFLGVVIAMAAGACGGKDNAPQQAATGDPSDAPVPKELWIDPPTSTEEEREYCTGTRLNGLETVYSSLVVTRNGSRPSRSYELTEIQTNFGIGFTAARWAGNLTIESLPRQGVVAYRLDGGVSPGEPRVFVKWGDTLYFAKDLSEVSDLNPRNLSYAATAIAGRVEVHHGILALGIPVPANIRLRVGQALVVRLGPGHSVTAESNPAPVRQEGSREEQGGRIVLTYTAVAPGSAELVRIDPPTDTQPGRRISIAGIKVN